MVKSVSSKHGRKNTPALLIAASWISFILGHALTSVSPIIAILLLSIARVLP